MIKYIEFADIDTMFLGFSNSSNQAYLFVQGAWLLISKDEAKKSSVFFPTFIRKA